MHAARNGVFLYVTPLPSHKNARRGASLGVNPHRHTAAFREWLRTRGYPHGFHRGLNARWHPACAGCMRKQAELTSANRVSMHITPTPQKNARCPTTPAAFNHARPLTTYAPRLARGATLHQAHGENRGGDHPRMPTTERRRMAVWMSANAHLLTALVGTNPRHARNSACACHAPRVSQ